MKMFAKGLSLCASVVLVLLFSCATVVHVREALAQTAENCALDCCDVETEYFHNCYSGGGSCSNCIGYLCCVTSGGSAGCIAGGIGC